MDAQPGSVATRGMGDKAPVKEREPRAVRRVVASRALAFEDSGFQGWEGERREDLKQMTSAHGRSGFWWILRSTEPPEESPDGRFGAKHLDFASHRPSTLGLALIGRLNTSAEARYERGRHPFDRSTASLIRHDGRLVDRNEHVVVRACKLFDDRGRAVEAGGFRQAGLNQTVPRKRS